MSWKRHSRACPDLRYCPDSFLALVNGYVYTAQKDLPKSEPEARLTNAELEMKFISLATDAVSEKRAREIAEIICGFERVQNVREFTGLLQGKGDGRKVVI